LILASDDCTLSVLLTKYFSGYQITRTEIDGACGTCGEEARCISGFCGGNLKATEHLKYRRGYEDNIKIDFQAIEWGMG